MDSYFFYKPSSTDGVGHQAYQDEFLADSLHCARDVCIKGRVARLKNHSIVFLPPDEEFCGVYLTYVEDAMDGNLD